MLHSQLVLDRDDAQPNPVAPATAPVAPATAPVAPVSSMSSGGDDDGWTTFSQTYGLLARQVKGIAVVIRANRMAAFLPFSHAVSSNTWGAPCTAPAGSGGMLGFLLASQDGRYPPVDAGRLEQRPYLWGGNGHLVRYEVPQSHSDSASPPCTGSWTTSAAPARSRTLPFS